MDAVRFNNTFKFSRSLRRTLILSSKLFIGVAMVLLLFALTVMYSFGGMHPVMIVLIFFFPPVFILSYIVIIAPIMILVYLVQKRFLPEIESNNYVEVRNDIIVISFFDGSQYRLEIPFSKVKEISKYSAPRFPFNMNQRYKWRLSGYFVFDGTDLDNRIEITLNDGIEFYDKEMMRKGTLFKIIVDVDDYNRFKDVIISIDPKIEFHY